MSALWLVSSFLCLLMLDASFKPASSLERVPDLAPWTPYRSYGLSPEDCGMQPPCRPAHGSVWITAISCL